MDIADRIPDVAPAPPPRGIRVVHHHRDEQRQEAARAPAARQVAADRVCLADAECRDHLRAAVMEISRLQRGILTAGERAFVEQVPRWLADPPPDPKAAPPTERKAYAPDPVGKSPEPRDTTPPDPSEAVRVTNWFHVNNLGELLDILV
jgi:hypothetical protein